MKSESVQRILNNTPNDIKISVDIYADLVVHINQIIKDKNIITSDKPELTKWLNGESDLTLKSISLLSAELGEPLLIVTKNIKVV